jgi:hypothetical protein
MAFLISTGASAVTLDDLGARVIPANTTNFDLSTEYNPDILMNSVSLANAIYTNGATCWNQFGVFITAQSSLAATQTLLSNYNINLASGYETGILPIANGGTGSSTQNFVDISTAQTAIAGAKTWTALGTFSAGIAVTGANTNINTSSNFNTLINGGTSTGSISIGNSSSTGITGNVGTGNFTLDGTGNSSYTIGLSTTTGNIGIGGESQTGTITIGQSNSAYILNLAKGTGTTTLNIANDQTGGSINIGNSMTTGTITIGGAVAQTGTIILGQSTATNLIRIGDGTGTTTIQIGTGITNTKTIQIGTGAAMANNINIGGTGANTIAIGNTQATGSVSIGNAMVAGTITIGGTAQTGTLTFGNGTGAQIINIGVGGTGAKTINIGTGAADNIISIGNTTAGTTTGVNIATATAQLHIGPGTQTANQGAPLKLSSGLLLTSPETGAIEFDGLVFYTSPVARGLSPSEYIIVQSSAHTGNNATGVQAVFNASTNGAITLAAGTYNFEGLYNITRAAGNTSHTTSLAFGGTAVLTSIGYLARTSTTTGAILGTVSQLWIASAAATVVTAASTSTTENLNIQVKGTVRVTTAGTFIPQFSYSAAPGGTPSINTNSFFKIFPLGTNAVTVIGNWS